MSLLGPEQTPKLGQEALISRGTHASRLLRDEVLAEAHEDAERAILKAWLEAESSEARDAAWAKVHAMKEVRSALERMKAEGEYAARKR